MTSLTSRLETAISRVCAAIGEAEPAEAITALSSDELRSLLVSKSEAAKALELVGAVAAAEAEKRSRRELGREGMAATQGHKNGTSLVQAITGQNRADVRRAIQAGADLLEAASGVAGPADGPGDGAVGGDVDVDGGVAIAAAPWFQPLTDAMAGGVISQAQFGAIRRGLGEPPVDGHPVEAESGIHAAWRNAAEVLLEEAADQSAEDLAASARIARDTLDPAGAAARFAARYERRGFRFWTDGDGVSHGHFAFEDEGGAWVREILNSALRPRRGPRFVDSPAAHDDRPSAADDARTNDQLQYDTMIAVLRTGANADPNQAFGDRQPGIRIVVTQEQLRTRDERDDLAGIGHLEDTGVTVSGPMLEKYLCDAAATVVTVDGCGQPLDLGREARLFSARQRIALRVRDGGCIWPGCEAEPSRCEAHHCDHWAEDRGRTDVCDGVLLCQFHHLTLHNRGWRIRRVRDQAGKDTYWLHHPPGPDGNPTTPPIRLRQRSPIRFEGLAPPGTIGSPRIMAPALAR